MAGTPDFLLTLGIDYSELKNVKTQVAKELSSLNFAQQMSFIKPGQTGLIDVQGRAIASVSKSVKELGGNAASTGDTLKKTAGTISIWALGWTAVYTAIRIVGDEIKDLGAGLANLNEVMLRSKIIVGELSDTFKTKWLTVQEDIFSATKKGLVPLKGMTDAFAVLVREGINPELAVNATKFARQLSVISGLKPEKSAEILAEFYDALGESIKGVSGETGKFETILARLIDVTIKGNVPVNEFYTAISRISLVSRDVGADLDFLTRAVIFLDSKMISGRRASAALSDIFTAVLEKTHELNKALGTRINPRLGIIEALNEIKRSVEGLSVEEKRDVLGKVFDKQSLAALNELLSETDVALKNIVVSSTDTATKLENASNKAHALALGINELRAELAAWIAGPAQKGGAAQLSPYVALLDDIEARGEAIIKAEALATQQKEAIDRFLTYGKADADLGRIDVKVDFSKLSRESENYLANLRDSLHVDEMMSIGIDRRAIAQHQINDLIAQSVREQSTAEGKSEVGAAMRLASTMDIVDGYKALKMAGLDDLEAQEKITELARLRLEITKENLAEVKAFADELKGITVDFTKNLMSGTANIKDMLGSLSSAYQSQFAEQLGSTIADTGFFGEMANAFVSPLQKARASFYDGIFNASVEGSKLYYNAITSASSGGSFAAGGVALPGGNKGTAVGGMLAGLSALTGIGAGTAQTGTQGKVLTAPADYYKSQQASTQATSKLTQAMSSAGQVAGVAGGLYSAYSGITAQKGQGVGQGFLGGGLAGMQAGMMFGPVGAAVGFIAGGILGGIMGKKGDAGPAPQAQSYRIESAIRLSNSHLQSISRSTAQLVRGQEKYLSVATQSAYFRESPGIEGRFARDVLRA